MSTDGQQPIPPGTQMNVQIGRLRGAGVVMTNEHGPLFIMQMDYGNGLENRAIPLGDVRVIYQAFSNTLPPSPDDANKPQILTTGVMPPVPPINGRRFHGQG